MGWTQDATEFYRQHPVTSGNVVRPEEVVGTWLRICGQERRLAEDALAVCRKELEMAKVGRQQDVTFRQELAAIVGEPYPAPKKILEAVKRLKGLDHA